MSVSGIGSSTMSQSQSVWQAQQQQWQQDFQDLGTALQSGNIANAQQDFQSLMQGLSGSSSAAVASSTGSSSTSGTSLSQDLTALGSALQSGNLTAAQQAFQTLTQGLQSLQQTQGAHHHHHHHHSQAAVASSSGTDAQTPSTASGTAGNTINTIV